MVVSSSFFSPSAMDLSNLRLRSSSLSSFRLRLYAALTKCLGYPLLMKWVQSIMAFLMNSESGEYVRKQLSSWENGNPLSKCLGCSDEYNK